MKLKSVLCLALFTLALLAVAGCQSPSGDAVTVFQSSPASLEHKAKAITLVAVNEVLKKHPNAAPKLQIAADDLQIIEQAETLDASTIQEIIARLPPDTFNDPNTGFYIQAGILFFSDELGTLAAKNPDQLRSAARGMRLAIEQVLAK